MARGSANDRPRHAVNSRHACGKFCDFSASMGAQRQFKRCCQLYSCAACGLRGVLGGIADTDPCLLEMAKVYRLPLTARLRYIWLPGIFPSFCQSCIAAMGMCWKSGVSAEVIGLPDHSVGDALYRAKITLSTPDVFAWTLVIVLLSAVLSGAAAKGLTALKTKLCGEAAA